MNVRTLARRPDTPPHPAWIETWEITWSDREVEVFHQRGAHSETRTWQLEPDEVADFVREAIEEQLQEGFVEATRPALEEASDAREHPVVGHARAHPDDLLARQALGDWIHEQGDAYGALVGRWLATPHGPARTRLGLEAHRALFDGWTDDEVAARWDDGFLTELGLYVAHGRSETLTKKIPALLRHPATWLLRRIAICSLPGEPLVGEEAVCEREALWTIVEAIAQAGPHPTVRRLEITCEPGETFDIFDVIRSLPGLTDLVVSRALGPMWPWPGSVRRGGHASGWHIHVGLELEAGALSALAAFEGGDAPRPQLDELRGIRQVPVRPDDARPLEPRRLHFDGEPFDLGTPEPIERLEGWLDPDGYLADDDEVGIDFDQEPQQSPHEWLELVPEGTVDAWGDDDEVFNDPWDVGEPTHVDV